MAETSPGTPASAGRQESLSRSEDRIAAGEGVPLRPILNRPRASAERRLAAERGVAADGARRPPQAGDHARSRPGQAARAARAAGRPGRRAAHHR
jgi:hypothetical protein